MTDLKGNMFFEGPAGRLEAILKEPPVSVTRCAIVCHPHPLYGGTMHNKVVYRIAKAFEQAEFAVLRFNFRGTGGSQGEHDLGRGEQDDLRAAINFMSVRYAGPEIWAAGFSFGAAVALRVGCNHDAVRALVAAGLPVSTTDFASVVGCDRPKLFVQGSRDQFGSAADLQRVFEKLVEPKRLRIIEGADHFFDGQLQELQREVSDFIKSL
jgi:uncharacterized protein